MRACIMSNLGLALSGCQGSCYLVDKYIDDPALSLAVSEEHAQPLLSCADDSATLARCGNNLAVEVDVFSGEDALEAYVHTEEQFGQDVWHIFILDVRRSVLPADTAQGRGVLRGLASGPGIGPRINVIITTIFEGQHIGCSARLWWWRARLWWWRARTGRVPWWHRDSML